ncbi:MAG: mandelate racemase/muconate lactonizing enzyme family protein [Steroidobacteraceae bacterium]
MILDSISASSLVIPFTQTFRHAAASRSETETLWIEARSRDGICGFGEGCPRAYVTGENLETAAGFVVAHRRDWIARIADIVSLSDWVLRHRSVIDRNPAAWNAVELALLDLLGKTGGRPVEALLGLPELAGSFCYTAVLGDASSHRFEAQLAQYVQTGFRDFKIKLSGDRARDRSKVRALAAAGVSPESVRADANGLWRDASIALRHLRALDYPFFAVEEPLSAGDYRGMRRLATELGTCIILDESLLRVDQLDQLGGCPERWIVNLRVSKMGGLVRSLELLSAVRRLGCRVICGAHVGETSLLTRAALMIGQNARDLLVGQEGAFGTHLLSVDVAVMPIMFGPGGVLDVAALRIGASGLGLQMSRPLNYGTPHCPSPSV